MDTIALACQQHTWDILMMLTGAFLLGLLLGYYLWYVHKKQSVIAEKEAALWKAKYMDAEKELAAAKHSLSDTTTRLELYKSSLEDSEISKGNNVPNISSTIEKIGITEGQAPFGNTIIETDENSPLDALVAKTGYDAIFNPNNFQIIEGIGPKIEQLFKKAGFNHWEDLSTASVEGLQRILAQAGPSFQMHDPTSWPHQASLALAGDWETLIQFQKTFDVSNVAIENNSSPSKVEKLSLQAWGFKNNITDLKIVVGIDAKIEAVLKDKGIQNWDDLSSMSVESLKSTLDSINQKFKYIDTWPRQSKLAKEGNFLALKIYQDTLTT